MLFYNFDVLDNFINSNLIIKLEEEKEKIIEIQNLYKSKKENILTITNNIIELADSIRKNKTKHFYETITILKETFEKINFIENLTYKLEENLNLTIVLYKKGLEYNNDEIKANLVEYNKQRDELSNLILEFEELNTNAFNSVLSLYFAITNRKFTKNDITINSKPKFNIELEPHDNNTLIVSEKEQKAYLPFFYSDIKKFFENSSNQYKTLQDVVDSLYIIPLEKFKNSAIARFRESFNLIRNKEKSSITKAIDLGLELMFKYELNPIVIAACRNLDELDIYLDCLEENELSDFSCFEIKFEIMPQLTKKNTRNTFLF